MVDVQWKKTHRDKVALARRFYRDKIVGTDIGDRLEEFNELRKDVAYDEPTDNLRQLDLEDIASDLEEFVDEVESLVRLREKEEGAH